MKNLSIKTRDEYGEAYKQFLPPNLFERLRGKFKVKSFYLRYSNQTVSYSRFLQNFLQFRHINGLKKNNLRGIECWQMKLRELEVLTPQQVLTAKN